jgi:hypothetical protein
VGVAHKHLCNDRMPHAKHAWEVITHTLLMCTLWGPTQPATVSVIQLQYKYIYVATLPYSFMKVEGYLGAAWELSTWVQLGISGGVMSAVGNEWRRKQLTHVAPSTCGAIHSTCCWKWERAGQGGSNGVEVTWVKLWVSWACVMRRNQGCAPQWQSANSRSRGCQGTGPQGGPPGMPVWV